MEFINAAKLNGKSGEAEGSAVAKRDPVPKGRLKVAQDEILGIHSTNK
jgi:hypothetical protein